jgi:hypothetical protein
MKSVRFEILIAVIGCFAGCPPLVSAQARAIINTSFAPVNLSTVAGHATVLGSVLLGKPRVFTTFNIQTTGTITPDPEIAGETFELQFLICDQPDCTGEIKTDARILPDSDSEMPTELIARRSFGVSTHNAKPVVLTNLQPSGPPRALYLAVALKTLHNVGSARFTGRVNLLRVDLLP